MYLKSLELTGFKSFGEAKIVVPQGITAVVGPNGTGKSNVVDAILWVLGEQSAKTLRSERMEDVIFNGTEARKPLGMAEVSLVIAGVGDEKLESIPGIPFSLHEYPEVMLTRRLYRNGESEYLINKTSCRLKDIRSLLLDTRAGIKGHTVIEQGRIDQILNASPQDRRELIEETAGIVRYKRQKAEALRKLEATQQNLLRVRDIVAEVRRQLNSLERQARQAQSYQKYVEEAKTLEIRLLVGEARGLLARQAQVQSELADTENKESVQAAEEARLTTDLEEVKLRMAGEQESLSRIREDLAQVEQQQGKALTSVEVERNRVELYGQQQAQASEDLHRLGMERDTVQGTMTELGARLSHYDAELTRATHVLQELERDGQVLSDQRKTAASEEAQARQDILESTIEVTNWEQQVAQSEARCEDLDQGGERLAADQADLDRQRLAASDQLLEAQRARHDAGQQLMVLQKDREGRFEEGRLLEQQLQDTVERAGRGQEDVASVDSRLRALEGVLREEMGYGRQGEEETTSLLGCEGVRQAAVEWLDVPSGLERAVEAVLGERGRAWLVQSPIQACRAVAFLRENELGRGSFIPLDLRRSGHVVRDSAGEGLNRESGVVGWALDLVSAPDESRDVLTVLFEGVLIVESLEVALRLWQGRSGAAPAVSTFVTLAGELLDASGVVTGGELESSGGLLQRRTEIHQLRSQRSELEVILEETRQSRNRLAGGAESNRAALQELDHEIRTLEMRILTLQKDEEGLSSRLEELDRRLVSTRLDCQKGAEDRIRFKEELERGREQLARLQAVKANREEALTKVAGALSDLECRSLAIQDRLTEARMDLAALRARREHDEGDMARLLLEQEERAVRLQALHEQMNGLALATQQSRAESDRQEALARELGQRADGIRTDYLALQEAQVQDQEISQRLDQSLDVVRKALASIRDERTAVEVRRAEINTELGTLEHTLEGTYQFALPAALDQYPPESEESSEDGLRPSEEAIALALREELQTVRKRLERIGPVNLAAIQEHKVLEERYIFLTTQEQDLSNSMKSLREIIQKINRTTKQMFLKTFNELQEKFGEVFTRFFPGGRAELVITESSQDSEDSEEPGDEPGVDIVAQPPGKRLKSITMLSGGEKSLTAIALIFASFLIRPTPFCILDEIDAPLDEENIGRFTQVLRELSADAQFIVITHNKCTMAVADSLFGVTMEDPGVSKLLSIRLADLQPA